MLLAALLAILEPAVGIPVNVVSGFLPGTVTHHRLLWSIAAAGFIVVIVAVVLWLRRLDERAVRPVLAGQVPSAEGRASRPELRLLVSALVSGDGAVALTTGLTGAGGFGKTTLAAQACRRREVARRFRDGIVWITVGRDQGPALAARISETVRNLGGDGPAFTSLEQAGQALAAALAARGSRVLLVADDVWDKGQLDPFLAAGQSARLLVTTRSPRALDASGAHQIRIDAVTREVARAILRRGLPPAPVAAERELLELAGGWPLLLSLINRRLAADLRAPGGDIGLATAEAARRLRVEGRHALDVADSGARENAVAATIDYSLETLGSDDQARFRELGIFAEDAEVPLAVVGLLWHGTADLSQAETEALCDRMDQLSLVSLAWAGQVRVLAMHDVIRDYAGRRLGQGTQSAHAALVGEARALTRPTAPAGPGSAGAGWWRLPSDDGYGYLWQFLAYHLEAAGMTQELEEVCGDLRFAVARLQLHGPAALEADLLRSGDPAAGLLGRVIAQSAHLLGPVHPAAAMATILSSRLSTRGRLADQLPALRRDLRAWTAQPEWPLPDKPPGSLVRVLPHGSPVLSVAFMLYDMWLATGGADGTVRVWQQDGKLLHTMQGHPDGVNVIAAAPDSSWLATSSSGELRIWEDDGTLISHIRYDTPHSLILMGIEADHGWLVIVLEDRALLLDPANGPLVTVEGPLPRNDAPALKSLLDSRLNRGSRLGDISWFWERGQQIFTSTTELLLNARTGPEGSWLVDWTPGRTSIRRAVDGTPVLVLTGAESWVSAVASDTAGSWLAVGMLDGTIVIRSGDGELRSTLEGHPGGVNALAAGLGGTRLVSGGQDGTARIWSTDPAAPDVRPGSQAGTYSLAVAPGGPWLASGCYDGEVHVWASDGTLRRTLHGHRGTVHAVSISPFGDWLASADESGEVRLWAPDGELLGVAKRDRVMLFALAIARDGTRLAAAGDDGAITAWRRDGTLLHSYDAGQGQVQALCAMPDGRLASGGENATVRVWDQDGRLLRTLEGHDGAVCSVAAAPGGGWVASGGEDRAIRVWDQDGRLLRILRGHQGPVRALAFSPDGKWLASGSSDGTARIWAAAGNDGDSATAIRVDGSIQACAWQHQGTRLYLAGSKGLYLFSLDPPEGDEPN
jgi:WD40 repeat protein